MVVGGKDREEMRLIDADKLIEELKIKTVSKDAHIISIANAVVNLVNNQPTAFDTEKVVEQLVNEKRYGSKYDYYYEENLYRGEMFENDVNNKTIDNAIDIVKKGGVE